ncbi:MAG: GyrI-like domain-containing protein [Saprospiraceae bacterium]|nr:GyrI-like domain-containing protein [Lewinella sp.]
MEKLDLKKKYKSYYSAASHPEIREIEAAQYLSILGKGDPDSTVYAERVGALFAVSYGLKFAFKARNMDFVVAKLEGLWWFDEQQFGTPDLSEAPQKIPRSEWQWRMMIRIPEYVREEDLGPVREEVATRKNIVLAREVECYRTPPEKVVQMMHVGPFNREVESLLQIQAFCQERGLQKAGLHHEIYLSDIKKVDPEKWRTILREPVQ